MRSTSLYSYVPFDATCPATPIDLTPTIEIPTRIAIGGTEIGTCTDSASPCPSVEIDRSVGRVEVTWDVDPGRLVDVYVVKVHEVRASGPATVLQTLNTTHAVGKRVSVDAALFASGHFYIIEVAGTAGIPGAASGDLVTLEYPINTVNTYSGMFRPVSR